MDIRNRYLHSGPITNMADDARRAVKAAYKLLTIFLGFPPDLFRFKSSSSTDRISWRSNASEVILTHHAAAD
jgi:hypothetical protein